MTKRLSRRSGLIAVTLTVMLGGPLLLPGASHALRRLHPIEQCWFQTQHRDDYVVTNGFVNEQLPLVDFDDGDIRMQIEAKNNERLLFCPFMSDDLLSHHRDDLVVRLQGFDPVGGGGVSARVCADEHFGISTSCSASVATSTTMGTFDFAVQAEDAVSPWGGWFDNSNGVDRENWYPYIVYTIWKTDTLFLTGYRVDAG